MWVSIIQICISVKILLIWLVDNSSKLIGLIWCRGIVCGLCFVRFKVIELFLQTFEVVPFWIITEECLLWKKKSNKIKSIIYFCCCDLLKVEDVTFLFYSVYQVTPFQHSPVSSGHTWVVTAWVEYLQRNDEETVCISLILKNCSWKLWHQLENQIDSPCIARNLITKVNTAMINTNACLASSFVCVTITMYSLCYFFRFQLNFPSDCIRNMIVPLMDKIACLLSEACGSSPITRTTHSLSDELSNKWENT